MSTYKLSPLEKLRLEKKHRREERSIARQRLTYQMQYLNDNWGTMLTKDVALTVKTKFAETIDTLSGGKSYSVTPFVTKKRSPWAKFALSSLPLIGSISWRVAKPALIAFAIKRGSSLLFKKKKRK